MFIRNSLRLRLGKKEKAYEMYEFYHRSARLDLDDYNNDTEDGCHITSMAGTWMSIVKGFGGMRVRNGQVYLAPFVPENWNSFSFKIRFKGNLLNIKTYAHEVLIENLVGDDITIFVYNEAVVLKANSTVNIEQKKCRSRSLVY